MFDPSAGGSRRIVIFGTQELGRRIGACARAAGLDICGASDNSALRWTSDFDGVPIVPPREAVARFGDAAVFVIAIYNSSAAIAQLRALGCRRVATFPEFFLNFSSFFEGMSGLVVPEELLGRRNDIEEAYELLGDSISRREYRAQIAWRCTLDDSSLARPSPFEDMHFDRSVYSLSKDETLVDCGAFDGDSLRAFIGHTTDGSFRRAYALEPDEANRERLEAYVDTLQQTQRRAVTVLPFAASDRNGTMRFDAGLSVASHANERGAIEVQCRRLDDTIDGSPTLVKMDIEGAEPLALRGAAALIRRARPVLAICAYHYCEHFWEIPKLLRMLAPGFRISLRRYAEQCWETVYYAVPPERFASSSAD